MCKLAASEVAVRTTERAIQTMGGWGYIKDHPVEKWYRDAKLYTIFEGTSEIQRVVISNALGAADGKPPLHVDLEPTGGPLHPLGSAAAHRRALRCAELGAGHARSHSRAGHGAGNESAQAAQEVAWRYGRQDDGSARRQSRGVALSAHRQTGPGSSPGRRTGRRYHRGDLVWEPRRVVPTYAVPAAALKGT